ncbi:MAPEG family protein [Paraburkholderia youngii]|uniref:MAPEG family protein n=1 Tax=Paraburkholderia youngii TaxID=2782701 RepID=UPI0020CBE49C|nr:MAPEG family protein [Paraburkholderia youngii]
MNTIALNCTGVLGLLLFVLGLTITVVRSRVGLLSGYAPEPDRMLTKPVRAHGNTAEYASFFAVLFLYLGSQNPPHWQLALPSGRWA